ncbi:hypothetical protein J2Y02_002416 [Neobacillus drentensis]|nr:hypothetical protein [Neobacillus drentensis]
MARLQDCAFLEGGQKFYRHPARPLYAFFGDEELAVPRFSRA